MPYSRKARPDMPAQSQIGELLTNEEWCLRLNLNPKARAFAEAYLVVTRTGEVKLGRFKTRKDPDAPSVVVVGGGKGTIARAKAASRWMSPFPVITKTALESADGTPLWRHRGLWRVVGHDIGTDSGRTKALESAPHRAKDENPPVGVLFLQQMPD